MNEENINWDEDPCIFIFNEEIAGKMKMHVKNLNLHDWVRMDSTYSKQMTIKKKLYQTNMQDIFVTRDSPITEKCKQEFYGLLTEHLLKRFPNIFEQQGEFIKNRVTGEVVSTNAGVGDGEDVMLRAGRLTQDDWIILEPEESTYVLTAGNLCFPSNWALEEKFNKPMQMIHEPVKPYLKHLKDKVDSLFLRMKPDKPMWRANWGIYSSLEDTFDLFTHPKRNLHCQGGSQQIPFEGEITGKKLFLRCEYQTLRKLPGTGCIVFGIRTYMRYLSDMRNQTVKDIQNLIDAIEDLDEEYLSYKGGDIWKDAAVEYLRMLLNEKSKATALSNSISRSVIISGVLLLGIIAATKIFRKYIYS